MKGSVAVLCSGGLDSAVLLAWCARRYRGVVPLFIESGFRWERAERLGLERFLSSARLAGVKAPIRLSSDNRDVVRRRWVLPGGPVPGRLSACPAVYIPGRNLLLLSKAAVYCAESGVHDIALGVLRGNPFGDSTRAFLRAFEKAASLALGWRLRVHAPFRRSSKASVIRTGAGLPLEETFSCIAPRGRLHCGRCAKCYERQQGFKRAGVTDATRYA